MIKKIDIKNILCFVCTELQKPPGIHASRLEYPLNKKLSYTYNRYIMDI